MQKSLKELTQVKEQKKKTKKENWGKVERKHKGNPKAKHLTFSSRNRLIY